MTDREKVIKGLAKLKENSGCIAVYDCDCKTCPYDRVNGCCSQVIEDAIALLKAQEPVEPQEKREGDYKNLYCGACGRGIVGYVGHLTGKRLNVSNYCNKCGKAVKWK